MDIEDIGVTQKRKLASTEGESVAAKVIKTEPVDSEADLTPNDAAEQIVAILGNFQSGIKDAELRKLMPAAVSSGLRVKAINMLLQTNKVELFTQGKELVYKLREDQANAALKDATVKEQIVYEIIRQAGNKGIWNRDIRAKSNLMQQEVTKILKNMESKGTIKSVKLASANKKKLYMLSSLEPDSSITGDVWFANEEYDAEFVQVVTQQCHRYLQQKASAAKYCFDRNPLKFHELATASPSDICQFLQKLGLTKVELAPKHVERLLDALVYEGKVEKRTVGRVGQQTRSEDVGQVFYMVNPNSGSPQSPIMSPCLKCPVSKNCSAFGRISPLTCPYLSNIWTYCKECGDSDDCQHMTNIHMSQSLSQ